jgi:ssDNA-binding Zn-finger/Zn-ribbon topoisomerase 1
MLIHKCEACEAQIEFRRSRTRPNPAAGWTGTGRSRWGTKYDRHGVAWYCTRPECRKQKNWHTLDLVFPEMPEPVKRALMDEIEREKIGRN